MKPLRGRVYGLDSAEDAEAQAALVLSEDDWNAAMRAVAHLSVNRRLRHHRDIESFLYVELDNLNRHPQVKPDTRGPSGLCERSGPHAGVVSPQDEAAAPPTVASASSTSRAQAVVPAAYRWLAALDGQPAPTRVG